MKKGYKIGFQVLMLLFVALHSYGQTTAPKPAAKPKPKAKTTAGSKTKKGKKGAKEAEGDYYLNAKGKKVKKPAADKVVDVKSIINSKKNTSAPKPVEQPNQFNNRPMTIGNKTITGYIGTAQGFRICVYNGTSRNDALAQKQLFMKKNHDLKSYMRYNTPYYKIVIGDYKDKKVAQKALKKILVDFPAAFVVPDEINVKDITIYQRR